jgi:hypothetical protein
MEFKMKNLYKVLIITLFIATFGFGQPDPIWTFDDYWNFLPNDGGLAVAGALDIQNDGDLDILYTTDLGANPDIIMYPMGILINDGTGVLSLGSDTLLIDAESSQSGRIYVFDINNDGLDDAYIDDTGNDLGYLPGGQNILLIQDADGRLINETNTRLPIQNTWTMCSLFGDIDLDGDIDIINVNDRDEWNGTEVGTQLLLNDGNGYFTIDSTRLPPEISEEIAFPSGVLLDAENDGDLDLYLGNIGELVINDELYLNDGNGYFSLQPNAVFTEYNNILGEVKQILSTDFNNDTFDDILLIYQQYTDNYSELKLLLNSGDTTFLDASFGIIENDWYEQLYYPFLFSIERITTADLNNDGFMDFILGEPFTVYINNGDAIFTKQTGIIPFEEMGWDYWGGWYPDFAMFINVIPGDMDGDLDTDLFLSNYGEPLFVLYNPSNELNINESMQNIDTEYNIHQNYPNPFNPVTTLQYNLPVNGLVSIIIYNILGKEVKTLVNTTQDAGYKSVNWNATNNYGKPVSAGVYLYQIQAGEFVQTKKMVLLK